MNFSQKNFVEITEFQKQHAWKVSVERTKKFTTKQIH